MSTTAPKRPRVASVVTDLTDDDPAAPPPRVLLYQNPIRIHGQWFIPTAAEASVTRHFNTYVPASPLLTQVILLFYEIVPLAFAQEFVHLAHLSITIHCVCHSVRTMEACRGMEAELMLALAGSAGGMDLKLMCRVHPLPNILSPFGAFHPKLIIARYATRGCRVTVHTSNIEPHNLYYQSELAWSQDFPLLLVKSPPRNDFGQILADVLRTAGLHGFANEILAEYDFSTAEACLVFSKPIKLKGEHKDYGLGRLRALLRKWPSPLPVVAQSSSVGSQKSALERENTWLQAELCTASVGSSSRLKILAITRAEVATMRAATENDHHGTTTFFSLLKVPVPFPREDMWKWTPAPLWLESRAFAEPHCKTLVQYDPATPGEIKWVVVGSHNHTKAAWGRFTSPKALVLDILSFEVSVFLHPEVINSAGNRRFNVETGEWVQVSKVTKLVLGPSAAGEEEGLCPLPFRVPGTPYASDDVPWVIEG
jgi:hypothetical protein